jgi:hypothetical protein
MSRARQVAACTWVAGVALLVTACSSPAGSAAPSASSTLSRAAAASTAAAPAASNGSPGTPPTGAATFLAAAQNLNGTLLHEPACGGSGCALSGDSTAFLYRMTWTTWSGTEAVGTGTDKLDACHPDCAGGTVYPVAAVVTLSHPVKICSASGTRWVWSHASFTFPGGLPKALQGQNGPQNPWTFSALIAAAQPGCT